jgi:hypothetical protein
MSEFTVAAGDRSPIRCFTRTVKNARYLQELAPDNFARDPDAEGFGTGVPMQLLRSLHRIPLDSPVLKNFPAVAEALRVQPLAVPLRAHGWVFSGTVHFAQLTFRTPGSGDFVVPTVDMNQIVQYAQHAVVSISEYAAPYGTNAVNVDSRLLTKTVTLSGTSFTDAQLRDWVNDLASDNHFFSADCIFVVVPQGITAPGVGGNAGYHNRAITPYIVAGVFANGLTLADNADVYAMVVSHEIAEMVVDPDANLSNPEVCDPCDVNCGNLTRCYFDRFDNFLGSNQSTPPGGMAFSYYTCGIVRPRGAANCPAAAQDCQYAPIRRGRFSRPLALAPNAQRRLELFVVANFGGLQHIWQTSVSNGWSSWTSHGNPANVELIGQPAMALSADGRLELFLVGEDGAVWHIWQTAANNGWSGWTSHGKPPMGVSFAGTPGLAIGAGPGAGRRLELFAVGSDGALWHIWQTAPSNGWVNWTAHGNPAGVKLLGAPAMASSADGRLELFVVGSDGALWHIWQTAPGGGWVSWTGHGGPSGVRLLGSPTLAASADGRLELFAAGSDGALWHIWQTAANNGWTGWSSHGAPPGARLGGSPAMAANAAKRLELFVVDTEGVLWHIWQTAPSNGWSGWLSHGRAAGTNLASAPTLAASADGRLELFITADDGAVWHIWQTVPSGGWSSWLSHDPVPF